jgi:S-formylglutathione hydrolase FrmB
MRRGFVLAAFIAAVSASSAATAAAEPISVTREQRLDRRLIEFGLETKALASETNLRVLLPDGYDSSNKRYPVLYLLHGCCDYDVDGSQAWTTHGEVQQATAGKPLIVVMPAGGRAGFYTDWFNGGAGGPPEYETYHVKQLIPWVDSRFRTRPSRTGRAIAGLSMGGFGAMSYAARHPDLFVAAAAFSGAVDINDPVYNGEVDSFGAQDGATPGQIFGPRATELVRWKGHNPSDLYRNLRGLRLTLRTGNGQPGGDFGGGPDPVEMGVYAQMTTLHERLAAAQLPHVWDDYGPGAHAWPYWARDLRETLPQILTAFAKPPPVPARVRFETIEPRYSVYGWRVAVKRPALEFSRLEGAWRRGFKLTGSGTATVRTPPFFRPHRRVRVTVTGHRSTKRAGRHGRVLVRVPLGPGNGAQQDSPGADTKTYTTRVKLKPIR